MAGDEVSGVCYILLNKQLRLYHANISIRTASQIKAHIYKYVESDVYRA